MKDERIVEATIRALTENSPKSENRVQQLVLEVVADDEMEEQGYIIRCTDENDNVIEIYGFDTIYNTEEEAEIALGNILEKLKRGNK